LIGAAEITTACQQEVRPKTGCRCSRHNSGPIVKIGAPAECGGCDILSQTVQTLGSNLSRAGVAPDARIQWVCWIAESSQAPP
jgi:hypothetical protein